MNKVIIFAAPSGSGKTTIVRTLLEQFDNFSFSISATTRPIRHNEVDGKDYHFISLQEFKDRISNNEFLEYEEVYPNIFYGTLKSELNRIWESNHIVIFDVDVVGGVNIKNKLKEDALSIFVKPPSLEILEKRLINRSTDSEESIKIRLDKAKSELEYQSKYDYILINDDFDKAIYDAKEIISNFINYEDQNSTLTN